MNTIRICTVVTGKTLPIFLKNLQDVQQISNFIELRVDTIQNASLSDVESIRKSTHKKSIFTCRSTQEGGLYTGSDLARIQLFQHASLLEFDYIDIELSNKDIIPNIHREKIHYILSFHDYVKTPSFEELVKIKKSMQQFPGMIMKFATTVHQESDNQTLLQLLFTKRNYEDMITIGMGEQGKLTRVIAPLLGSYLTFASTHFGNSAPGQIDIHTMQNLYNNLRGI